MNIRGVGNATQRNMIVTATQMKGKDGKPDYFMVDAQADMRDPKTKALKDSNPHAVSKEFKTPEGQTRVAHGRAYTAEQFKKMQEAGTFMEQDGKLVGTLKADLMVTKDGQVLVNTKKPMEKSDYKVGPKTLENQAKAIKDMRAKNQAERAATKDAPEAEAEGPAKETEAELE